MTSSLPSRARKFALAAHGDQKYGTHPYSFHLDAVAEILRPFGEQAQAVGYLHDVAEDTAVTLDQIRALFGDHIAQCVQLVTDEPGPTRKDRKAISHAKLAKVQGLLELALIVKAADRLANLRMSAADPTGSKLAMYRAEHAEFRKSAYRGGLCGGIWAEIDAIINA